MTTTLPFHLWLKKRREALDLTREELAAATGCSPFTLRKLETGDRRPSRQLAERLADRLRIPDAERAAFLLFARTSSIGDPLTPLIPPLPPAAAPPAPAPLFKVPQPLTRLIGREAALRAAASMLRGDARIVTLTGPAGVGKTRLGMALAAELRESFGDGVVFVALAGLSDPARVLPAIAEALELGAEGRHTPAAALTAALGGRRALLILDNFEQLIAAGGDVAALAAACPALGLLVTSRAPLGVRGEHVLAVAPLALPDPQRTRDPLALEAAPAVALFVERVRALDPSFALTAANAPAVTALCARLDGLPLAIELVAARSRLLAPEAMLARLGEPGEAAGLDLLGRGPRDLPARHQTLRAAVAWSHRLLDPEARRLFARLSCFAEGWSVEEAEAICAAGPGGGVAVLEALQTLVESSLVYRATGGRRPDSFGMLETIRAYAVEALEASGEAEAVRRRHAEHYCRLAEATAQHAGGDQTRLMAELTRAQGNLRAALGWSLCRQEGVIAGWLGARLWRYWWMRGQLSEARYWLDQILACPTLPDELRGRILNGLAIVADGHGDARAARRYGEEALTLVRRLGDPVAISTVLLNFAVVLSNQGDVEEARSRYEESLELCRARGDQWSIATILNNLGNIALSLRDLQYARGRFAEALEIYRGLGDRHGEALAVANLGAVALQEGGHSQALGHYREALGIQVELGNQPGAVEYLTALARVGAGLGAHGLAALLLGAAEGLREQLGISRQQNPEEAAETVAQLVAALGPDRTRDAIEDGRGLSFEQAVACVAQLGPGAPSA